MDLRTPKQRERDKRIAKRREACPHPLLNRQEDGSCKACGEPHARIMNLLK